MELANMKHLFLGLFALLLVPFSFAEEEEEIEEVVVTGSRLGVTEQSSTSPIKIIDREDLDDLAVTSIGDFIQDLPQNAGGLNAQNNNGGNGSTTVSLRGLGGGRTLILLNGRRHVPYATGGIVDMNAIAPNTIERVDILLDGASAIYGSDAVGGVINIITKKDFDGLTVQGYSGRSSEGDGNITDLNVTFGASSDRGNVTVTLGSYKIDDAMAGDRTWSYQDLGFNWSAGTQYGLGSTAPPEGMIIDREGTDGNEAWAAVQALGTPYLWGPGGNNSSSTWSEFSFGGNSDAGEGSYYNYQPINYLYTPSERTNIFATANYELTDTIETFVEMSYIFRETEALLAFTPLFIISEGITVAADQQYNPFGRSFIDVRRRMVEAGPRVFNRDLNTYRFVGGAIWDINEWEVEGFINYGLTDGTYVNSGRFVRSKVERALGPAEDCTGSCVPLNLFGGPGTITQDMLDYISYVGTAQNMYSQNTYHISAKNQELFEVPAGFVGLLLGYESREEEGKYIPDPYTAAGDTTGNKGGPTSGSYTVDELFLEINAPIIEGLILNVAGRTSDYSNFGTTTNLKYGLRYDIIEGVLAVRGTMSEAFNAPSISSMFAGQSDSFPSAYDPCSTVNGDYATNPIVQANCDADGIGATSDPSSQLRTRVGGNPDLLPETADTVTFGIVYQPLDELAINVDYFSYEIVDTVGSLGATGVLGACYYSENRSRCDKIERVNGLITNIFATTTNIGLVKNEGIDVQVDYGFDTSFGRFDISADYTKLSKYEIGSPSSDGTSTVTTDCVDVYDCGVIIDGRLIVDLDWSYDQMSSRIRLNRYPSFEECQGDNCNNESSVRRDIEEVTYVSASFGYNFEQGTTATVVVSNLLDEHPPKIYNAFYSARDVAYDFIGRYIGLTVRHDF